MKKTIRDFDLNDKKVIIRCDLNVPIKDGVILDDNRIKESIKTIKYAISNNAKVILLSHLGRIKSKEDKENNSLKIICDRLSELLQKNVTFVPETMGNVVEKAINSMKSQDVIMLENTRYEDYPFKKESSNDEELGKYWASLGDIFINDAFATCHRAHASNVGIATYLPSGVGFLVEKELKMLKDNLEEPQRPYIVIMGGAKMNDKIKVLDRLIKKADYMLLAGGIANTFLKAMGYDMKASVYDEESINHAKELISKYKDKLVLPSDGYGSVEYKDGLEVSYNKLDNIKDDMMILDIGPDSVLLFSKYIKKAKTIFWNGPVGVSEFSNFEYGTLNICKILSNCDAKVIVGGGDSAAAVIRFGFKDKFTHVSTGGGASVELIEGKELPGLSCIGDK